MHVSHRDSADRPLPDQTFCLDCWTRWQNIRQNLDGSNTFGNQGMTCPHCQKPLHDLETETAYREVSPQLYDVRVNGTLQCMVTIDTKVENFKRTVLRSTLITPYTHIDEFDLAVDTIVLGSVYLAVPVHTNLQIVPRITKTIALRIYPQRHIIYRDVFETSLVQTLKTQMGLTSHILFDVHTGQEFVDTQSFQTCSITSTIAVLPLYLFQGMLNLQIFSIRTV
jgi:hypothetical protein